MGWLVRSFVCCINRPHINSCQGVRWRNFVQGMHFSQSKNALLLDCFSKIGSGCGSVGRVFASDTSGLQLESSYWQDFIMNIFTVNCWKDENKEKEAGNFKIVKCIYSHKTVDDVMYEFQNSALIPSGFLRTKMDAYFVTVMAKSKQIWDQFDQNMFCCLKVFILGQSRPLFRQFLIPITVLTI